MEYPKIQSVYLRDPETKHKTFLEGQFTCPEFDFLKFNEWAFTEKVDGTNIRVMWDGEKVIYGGRTDNASIPANLLGTLMALFSPELLAKTFSPENKGVVLFGEGYGAKIQNGSKYLATGTSFVLFDLFVAGNWQPRESVEACANTFGISAVPIIGEGTLFDAIEMTKKGFDSTWGPFQAEGIVARPKVELIGRTGHRIITKVKCKDWQRKGAA